MLGSRVRCSQRDRHRRRGRAGRGGGRAGGRCVRVRRHAGGPGIFCIVYYIILHYIVLHYPFCDKMLERAAGANVPRVTILILLIQY